MMQSIRYPLILQRAATVLATVTLTLTAIAAFSGILIAFYYQPAAGAAHNSLRDIATHIPSGDLVLSLHNIAGNLLIGIALIQMVVMFLGRRYSPSWLAAWVSGILMVLTAIALSWTAMVLGWDQEGYWRFRIELSIIESVPLMGSFLRSLLTGGDAVSTTTVQHLYTVHSYLLSTVAVGLAIAHLVALYRSTRQAAVLELSEQPLNLDTAT